MIRDSKKYNIEYDNDGNPLLVNSASGEVTQGVLQGLIALVILSDEKCC